MRTIATAHFGWVDPGAYRGALATRRHRDSEIRFLTAIFSWLVDGTQAIEVVVRDSSP
jgi:hypothetical protein